ncbi:Double-strand break repair protein MRE11 [Meyerozyma sp. JA9]|nr:Double-strand break repair protein MRE11 [Meyerozyma sp. JA9]
MPPTKKIPQGPNTISILITTDNHVGYHENDPIRGDDSGKTFEEITRIAKERDVDMVVQGGDLFHVNKPSKKSLYQVMKSLRSNCLGDRPCELQLISDPSMALTSDFPGVNYEDANLNIGVPVFAISGNHDDATGDSLLSPLDILAASGLVNYFGKVVNNEDITVAPLLFKKGTTKLALYGIGNVKDERLHRVFRDNKATFLRSADEPDSWFNFLCVHQNHVAHTRTSYIPENFLPKFMDFILWGHEHECIPDPMYNPEMGFDVLQPGSSVATALSPGEMVEKNVFIMNIRDNKYSIEPVKLKTVRPFIMDEVVLQKEGFVPGPASKDDVSKFLVNKVEELIQKATEIDTSGQLPLIRLRVDYTGDYHVENPRRFSNRFVGKIANVNDVILLFKKKNNDLAVATRPKFVDSNHDAEQPEVQLEDFLEEFLKQTNLALVPEEGINYAVRRYIENDDKTILHKFIEKEIEAETKMLLDMDIDKHQLNLDDELAAKRVFKEILGKVKNDRPDWNKTIREISNSKSEKAKAVPSKPKPKPQAKKSAKSAKSESIVLSDSDVSDESMEEVVSDSEGSVIISDEEASPEPVEKPPRSSVRNGAPKSRKTAATKPAPKKPVAPRKKASTTKGKRPETQGKKSLLDDLLSMGR